MHVELNTKEKQSNVNGMLFVTSSDMLLFFFFFSQMGEKLGVIIWVRAGIPTSVLHYFLLTSFQGKDLGRQRDEFFLRSIKL